MTASSQGTGDAGDINITARSLKLDNGSITTTSRSGQGGNIDNLQVQDLLLLRNHSQISTTSSGTDQNGGGNGGNITINAQDGFIIAAPNQNSDITANAFNGQGGKITINATGIYGMVQRNRQDLERLHVKDLNPDNLSTNDITAFSQQNPSLNGTVLLNTPDVDPSRGLTQLPANLVNASNQIDNSCNPGSKQRASSFTITGRGGLPPNPRTEPLTSDAVQVDWVSLKPSARNHKSPSVIKKPTNPTPAPIVQATGWTRNALGEVVLTVDASTVTPQNPLLTPASCHASRK